MKKIRHLVAQLTKKNHRKLVIYDLPFHWIDRDEVLFHAMFQVLVDFVELEMPFVNWTDKQKGRFTDQAAMQKFIDEFNAEIDVLAHTSSAMFAQLRYMKETFFLYRWYKDKRYILPEHPDEGGQLTMLESIEREQEHDILKDKMLHRILAVRPFLWT